MSIQDKTKTNLALIQQACSVTIIKVGVHKFLYFWGMGYINFSLNLIFYS